MDATAIITATESGYTARMVSKYRPKSPIVAVTANESVSRRLALVWGVYPQLGKESNTTDEMLDNAVDESLNSGYVTHGDLVVITAGVPVGEAGTTNLMKIHIVGDILAKAQGIGRISAYGKVVVAKNAEEALAKVKEGSILVTRSTDKEMVPAIEKCVALIAEEGGLTSHAAVVGLNLGIPVLVGVQDATTILKDDQDITVDPQRGVIYDGHASVI